MIRKIAFAVLMVASVLLGLPVNIASHEAGHYAVASYYDANPEIVFNITESGFGFYLDKPVAETIYSAKTTQIQDFWIALAGPAVNLIIFFALFVMLFTAKIKNIFVKLFLQYFAAISAMAFFMNIFPAGGTDGAAILSLLK
ncbi:MAG: M50 family metallopeptidase [DPANN group archaeon]|nr:M50 family metallopeptidase [DPANN group archaeon]